ncbi:MAG TPA: hypothetical protein PLV45_08900, partial [bacterium]|nr:hypothetical protein [bacterium]
NGTMHRLFPHSGLFRYLPPDFNPESTATRQTDIFALGVLLLELLDGSPGKPDAREIEALRRSDPNRQFRSI